MSAPIIIFLKSTKGNLNKISLLFLFIIIFKSEKFAANPSEMVIKQNIVQLIMKRKALRRVKNQDKQFLLPERKVWE